jgi:hypothetical protein
MSVTKIDLKRELPELYTARRKPGIVEVPELKFLMIDGHGDPNTSADYGHAIEALYSVAYTLKFTLKKGGSLDFPVMPLEGLWWAQKSDDFLAGQKSSWSWTAMLLQPDVVTEELVADAVSAASHKRSLPAAGLLRLKSFTEGLSAQVLHVGPYAEEAPTIAELHAFIAEQGYARCGKHHEIYLGDPRRSAPDRLRTIIRQPIGPTS